jgi:hypothetical protein
MLNGEIFVISCPFVFSPRFAVAQADALMQILHHGRMHPWGEMCFCPWAGASTNLGLGKFEKKTWANNSYRMLQDVTAINWMGKLIYNYSRKNLPRIYTGYNLYTIYVYYTLRIYACI